MDDPHLRVLLLDSLQSPELEVVGRSVREAAQSDDIRLAAGAGDVRRIIGGEQWFPDLIVALQSWSDEYAAADVLELLSLAPLARVVCVYGPWCDSDGRTRTIWPLATRVPACQAPERVRAELAALRALRFQGDPQGPTSAVRSAAADLPLTASRAEIFASQCGGHSPRREQAASAAVVSPDGPFRRMLGTALQRMGWRVIAVENQPAPTAIVWDADPWDATRVEELRNLRQRLPDATLIAAVALPHAALAHELKETAAGALWFKLAPLRTLAGLLVTPAPSAAPPRAGCGTTDRSSGRGPAG